MRRVLIACIALRTNLTIRELAALAGLPTSTLHRIVAAMTPRIATVHSSPGDRRFAWVIDGTLIPTRDHRRAAKAKNYRWSCNAQILIRRVDLAVVASTAGGPGNHASCETRRGAFIASAVHESSTRSLASRTGASFATTAAAENTST